MHVNGNRVVFWSFPDQVWLFLSWLATAAPVENVQGMSLAIEWCSGVALTK